MALVVMLFQFLAPAFISSASPEIPAEKTTAYYAYHSSVVAPTLLKEQDENENINFLTVSSSAPLLDLTSHSINLLASHKKKYLRFIEEEQESQEPHLTIFLHKFLI